MKSKKVLLSLLLFILIPLITIMTYFTYKRYCSYLPLSYQSNKFVKSTASLDNPYCGWYQIYPYMLSEQPLDSDTITKNVKEDPYRLAMIQINLSNYNNTAISDIALSQLDYILSLWSDSNKQLIIRFLYDWDGNISATEPADINIILNHIKQTSAIYNKYAKSIYILQGLFIGNYGEMHGSCHQSKEDIICLAKKIYEESDPSIFLAVRTPTQLRTISDGTNGLTDDRLSLFNDGMLASESDAGTYSDGERSKEISYQNELCKKVPNGGEVIINNPYNDFNNAIKDLKIMHVSYLNSMYDLNVLNKWKSATYNKNDIFKGCNGFEYINKHLGYRYSANSSSFTFKTYEDDYAKLSVTLKNTGFSTNYYPFNHEITCIDKKTGKSYSASVNSSKTDGSGKVTDIIQLEANIDVRHMTSGEYNIYLKTTDSKTDETIKYANDMQLTDNGYLIGTLTYKDKNFKSFFL